MRVVLGNRNAIHTRPKVVDGAIEDAVETMPKGKRATEVTVPDDVSFISALTSITHVTDGVWVRHAELSATPAWVASDSPAMAAALAEHYGCEVRELDVNPPSKKPRRSGGAAAAAGTALTLALALWVIGSMQLFLKTNAGNDFQAKQMGGSASATAVAKWMGLTANTTAESASDTTLTGEITTAGGGLIRQAGVYAHTTGAASYTITATFTANGSDSLPVTIGKAGIFDAVTVGNLVFEKLLTTTATLSAVGDALTLTQTVTL